MARQFTIKIELQASERETTESIYELISATLSRHGITHLEVADQSQRTVKTDRVTQKRTD